MLNPIVFVPGIKGSSIDNFYSMNVDATWSTWKAIAGPPLHRILLDATGQVDEADDVTNRAGQLLNPAYGKLVDGLRGRLNVPVYIFPYDWRLSNEVNGKRFVEFVEQIRKKPMRSIPGWSQGPRLVNVVGHSMGGLVARSALKEWVDVRAAPGGAPIDSLVFVATPHLGSLDAVKAMVTGDSPILDFQKELRKLARALPSAYELLPRYDRAVVDANGVNVELFVEGNWQSNVTKPSDGIQDVTQARLTAAKHFLTNLPSPTDPATPQYRVQGGVICLYGNKEASTLGRVPVIASRVDTDGHQITHWFDFAKATMTDGDQVVATVSARLAGCRSFEIRFSDVGWWPSELFAHANFHAFICTLDEIQTYIASFLRHPSATDNQLAPLSLRTWT